MSYDVSWVWPSKEKVKKPDGRWVEQDSTDSIHVCSPSYNHGESIRKFWPGWGSGMKVPLQEAVPMARNALVLARLKTIEELDIDAYDGPFGVVIETMKEILDEAENIPTHRERSAWLEA